MISIGLPSTVGPNSSTAILAASTEPGPLLSRPQLDRSVSTPIRTTSLETCALATVVVAAEIKAASMAPAKSPLIVVPSLLWTAWRGRLFWQQVRYWRISLSKANDGCESGAAKISHCDL